jgi:hypothetical protein
LVQVGARLAGMKDMQSRIDQCVDEFVASLQQIVGELAMETVGRRLSGRRTKKRRSATTLRRPAEVQALAEKLYAEICARPGERMMVLKQAVGQPSEALALPMRKLLASGRIRKTGSNQHTRYFPIGRQARQKRKS